MALAFTLTGLQTELEAFSDALTARDWTTAVDAANRYYAVRRGYVDKVSAEGTSVDVPREPSPTLYEQITSTKAVASASVKPRVIHANTSFRISR